MTDEAATNPSDAPEGTEALETQLSESDPAEAPPIAEAIAEKLGAELDMTQNGSTPNADGRSGDGERS